MSYSHFPKNKLLRRMSTPEMGMDTVPKYLGHSYSKWGSNKVAMRKKTLGIWNKYTWDDCYRSVKYLSLGLMSLGLGWGERVSIIGDNCSEWHWIQYAVQAVGGVVVGIFADGSAQKMKYILDHSDSKFAVVKDQKQVLGIFEKWTPLRFNILYDFS